MEGSTFWKFLTTLITRSVTSDLSRKEPRTSSQKWRRESIEFKEDEIENEELRFWESGLTATLMYFKIALRAAAIVEG